MFPKCDHKTLDACLQPRDKDPDRPQTATGVMNLMLNRLIGSNSNAPHLRRSKTNITNTGQIGQTAGTNVRSLTAGPNKKDGSSRPGNEREGTQLSQLQATGDPTQDAAASRQSTQSPTKATTPNPLKGVDLPSTISDEQQAQLKQTFNKLDTDKDGHIMFNQLQTQLPKQFSQAQEKYIKQVYEIVSSSTFFGLDEFMTMSYLTNVVTGLQGDALDAFTKLNFHNLNEVILRYVELYQSVDRTHKGKITLHSLQDILSTALSLDFKLDPQKWNKIADTLSLDFSGHVSKIEFLAHIPYFLTMKKQ